jgi:hypothetical protein
LKHLSRRGGGCAYENNNPDNDVIVSSCFYAVRGVWSTVGKEQFYDKSELPARLSPLSNESQGCPNQTPKPE